MFDRFTESAIQVILLAQEESRRLNHNFVGTEQILLGLIAENQGVAAKALKQFHVSLSVARREVEKIIGQGSDIVAVDIPFTPRAKRVLELSWQEATRLRHKYIGTEHLLLGLTRESEGVAARVLQLLKVDREKLGACVCELMGGGATYTLNLPSEPEFPLFPANTASLSEEPFNWYSPEAILLIQRAWGIADTLGNNEITPPHLFLAALRDDDHTSTKALHSSGLNLEQIRQRIFNSIKPGAHVPAKTLPFTADAQQALEYAWRVGVETKQASVTKECILLGILRLDNGTIFDVMRDLGADVPKITQSLIEALKTVAEKSKLKQSEDLQAALAESKRKSLYTRSMRTWDILRKIAIAWIVGVFGLWCVMLIVVGVFCFGVIDADHHFVPAEIMSGLLCLTIIGGFFWRLTKNKK